MKNTKQQLTAQAFLSAILKGETEYNNDLFDAVANAMEIYANAKIQECLGLSHESNGIIRPQIIDILTETRYQKTSIHEQADKIFALLVGFKF